ncbi:hypothetical protein GMDG_00534 [Pseudogymnoascus destructans 20631-21]|uniref:Zn(2)-C6 fungal-type domain-containing protein n=1 Tax=Pseudogymnoascus destructans (strain ATCC MYA-4855 / 20631-21) TaxID=658429 RepID=L8G5C9_PSED2|nr:hypothetical protein GMDG_00534 [Pseudogymnoascus destructans 20631-21]
MDPTLSNHLDIELQNDPDDQISQIAQIAHANQNAAAIDSSAPSPSMSQPQQSGAPSSRQPASYPSPTSYPSPGFSAAQYSYPAPTQQLVPEPYRASPTGSNSSISLPSMRTLDPHQQAQQQQQQQMQQQQAQQQQQQQHPQHMVPPPVAQMGGPYYHNNQTLPHPSHQYSNVTSDPTGQNMRYALPGPDNRVMSGGRHKKEIKRRTKTGCLTCRKRRIKCDEAHPACRNCQKSKRECLGYDPIFKQQPGPSPIQPAPSSAPLQAATLATANPYGNQPSMLQGYGAQVPAMAFDASLSAGVSSPGSAQQFDYSSAIDPALEAVAAPQGAPQFTQAKPCKVDDLLLKLPSKAEDFKPEQATIDEIKHLWLSIYVNGLESFLESRFYYTDGLEHLLKDKIVMEQFAILLNQFAKATPDNPAEMLYTASIEGRVVWSLACLVRSAAEAASAAPPLPRPDGIPPPKTRLRPLPVSLSLRTSSLPRSRRVTPLLNPRRRATTISSARWSSGSTSATS